MFFMSDIAVLAKMPKVDEIVIDASLVIIAVVSILLYIMAISDWLLSLRRADLARQGNKEIHLS